MLLLDCNREKRSSDWLKSLLVYLVNIIGFYIGKPRRIYIEAVEEYCGNTAGECFHCGIKSSQTFPAYIY